VLWRGDKVEHPAAAGRAGRAADGNKRMQGAVGAGGGAVRDGARLEKRVEQCGSQAVGEARDCTG